LEIEKEELLVSIFWSSLSALADIPENYKSIRCELSVDNKGKRLTITQDKKLATRSRSLRAKLENSI